MPGPNRERVLVLGAGAREHAIVQTLLRSPRQPEVICVPGNAGIAAEVQVISLDATDPEAVLALATEREVSLVVPGPEAPLVAGVSDMLAAARIPCFGPTAEAARLEASKAFCKQVMESAGVPTAAYEVASDVESAMAAIERYPVVIKADGLAAGKGVIIAGSEPEARGALERLLVEHEFGTEQVVVEEHLEGEELSLLALCDGAHAVPLASAQDFKRIYDADQGPNTGGMGSYSPVPAVDDARAAQLCLTIHQPVLEELGRRGTPFHGVLYAGLMMSDSGPKVLEFNVRFGDPETQAILPRLRSDLLELMHAATRPGGLKGRELEFAAESAVTVVLASAGYPASSSSGDEITGLEAAGAQPGVFLTHAGTARTREGRVVTAGGRVLSVTALAAGLPVARSAAYAAADMIDFNGRQMRRDIAERASATEPAV